MISNQEMIHSLTYKIESGTQLVMAVNKIISLQKYKKRFLLQNQKKCKLKNNSDFLMIHLTNYVPIPPQQLISLSLQMIYQV